MHNGMPKIQLTESLLALKSYPFHYREFLMVFYETMRNSFFGCSYGFRKIMSASKLLLLLN